MQIDEARQLIGTFYGHRQAARSKVPLINHIDEGRVILEHLGAADTAIVAFMLHPMFQDDGELFARVQSQAVVYALSAREMLLIMEYRNIANRSLSDIVYAWKSGGEDEPPYTLRRPIKVSPIRDVNLMLIADKVQNRKDFELHHKDTHPRSGELDFYFRAWLDALGIPEEVYQKLADLIRENANAK